MLPNLANLEQEKTYTGQIPCTYRFISVSLGFKINLFYPKSTFSINEISPWIPLQRNLDNRNLFFVENNFNRNNNFN